jgi:LysM repeat protein
MRIVVRLVVLTAVLALSVVAVAPAAAAPAPPAQPAPVLGQHTVQQGETLDCIGRAYKVEPGAIAYANGVTGSIAPGQVLKIPGVAWLNIPAGTTCTAQFQMPANWPILGQHTIQPGEWIYSIARAYKVNPIAIAQASGIPGPYGPSSWCGGCGWQPNPCGGCGGWQYGGCSPYGWCGWYSPWNYVYPGQVLQIPGVWWYSIPAGPIAVRQATVVLPPGW